MAFKQEHCSWPLKTCFKFARNLVSVITGRGHWLRARAVPAERSAVVAVYFLKALLGGNGSHMKSLLTSLMFVGLGSKGDFVPALLVLSCLLLLLFSGADDSAPAGTKCFRCARGQCHSKDIRR